MIEELFRGLLNWQNNVRAYDYIDYGDFSIGFWFGFMACLIIWIYTNTRMK